MLLSYLDDRWRVRSSCVCVWPRLLAANPTGEVCSLRCGAASVVRRCVGGAAWWCFGDARCVAACERRRAQRVGACGENAWRSVDLFVWSVVVAGVWCLWARARAGAAVLAASQRPPPAAISFCGNRVCAERALSEYIRVSALFMS